MQTWTGYIQWYTPDGASELLAVPAKALHHWGEARVVFEKRDNWRAQSRVHIHRAQLRRVRLWGKSGTIGKGLD